MNQERVRIRHSWIFVGQFELDGVQQKIFAYPPTTEMKLLMDWRFRVKHINQVEAQGEMNTKELLDLIIASGNPENAMADVLTTVNLPFVFDAALTIKNKGTMNEQLFYTEENATAYLQKLFESGIHNCTGYRIVPRLIK